jgi:hypothetical protein
VVLLFALFKAYGRARDTAGRTDLNALSRWRYRTHTPRSVAARSGTDAAARRLTARIIIRRRGFSNDELLFVEAPAVS